MGDQLFEQQLNDLFDALTNDDVASATELFEQIGDSRNTMAVGPLVILLESGDWRVRSGSASALGKIGAASAVEPLIKLLHDESAAAREAAAYALGSIGDDQAIGPLRNVSPDNPRVKTAADDAISRIDRRHGRGPLFKKQGGTIGSPPAVPAPKPVATDGGNATARANPEPAAAGPREAKAATPAVAEGRPAALKNPMIAAIASFLVPGLGQLYNGAKITKALLYMVAFLIGCAFLVLPGVAVWLYGIYDAYKTAKKINADELVPDKSYDTLHLVLYAVFAFVIMTVFLLVLFVVMAAVLAAFLLPVSYSSGDIQNYHMVSVMVTRVDTDTVKVTLNGKDVPSISGIRVLAANGTAFAQVSSPAAGKDVWSASFAVGQNTKVTVYADFKDGSSQEMFGGTVY